MKQFRFLLALLPCLLLCGCPTIKWKNVDLGAKGGAGSASGGGSKRPYDTSPGKFDYSGDADDTDTAFGAGMTFGFTPRISAEISYLDLGEFTWEGTWQGDPNTGSVETTGFRLGVTGLYPLAESGWSLVGTGGLLIWDQEGEEFLDGAPEPDIDDDGTDLYLGGGVQYDISDVLAARLILSRNFGVGDDDVDLAMLELLFDF